MKVMLLAYTQLVFGSNDHPVLNCLYGIGENQDNSEVDALIEYIARVSDDTVGEMFSRPDLIQSQLLDYRLGLCKHVSATFLVENISVKSYNWMVNHTLVSHSIQSGKTAFQTIVSGDVVVWRVCIRLALQLPKENEIYQILAEILCELYEIAPKLFEDLYIKLTEKESC